MAANPTLISNVRQFSQTFVNGDGTGLKAVVTPVSAGTRVKSLMAASDDTTARVLQLWLTISAVDYLLGEVTVPIGAGSDGSTPAVNLLNATNMPGLQYDGVNRFLDVANGSVLKIKTKVAVTAAKTVYILGEGGDFT